MKNKLLKIIIVTIMLLMYLQVFSYASTLTLDIKADKEELEVGEEVKIIVSWNQGMQAADFSLLYDAKKLEFLGSDLEDYFINSQEGEVKTAWFSIDNQDKTQIEYTFKAIKAGMAKLETKINGGFSTGELQIPDKYEEGSLKIKVIGNPIITTISVIGILLIFIFAIKKIIKK